jgi:hypothetical protein
MESVWFKGDAMTDLVSLSLILVFFVATLGLVWIAERLMR